MCLTTSRTPSSTQRPPNGSKDNNITTGSPAGSKTFKPDDPVTRGESVTFLNRYDTNVVQPAFADHLGKFAAHLGESADHVGRMEFDDHLGEFAAHLGESDGRMKFQAIDLALTRGDTVDVGAVDGVTIKITCHDAGSGDLVDIRVFAESAADGWYMPEHSETVLMMADVGEFIPLGSGYQSGTESAWVDVNARVQTIRTPNGGYIGIDPFDTVVIIHPTVDDTVDCLYMGVYKYFDPPT